MKNYYVESYQGWFIVNCRTKRRAHSEGVYEFGRGNVKEVRVAKPDEIATFKSIKGESALGLLLDNDQVLTQPKP